jgi:hypothetical protein
MLCEDLIEESEALGGDAMTSIPQELQEPLSLASVWHLSDPSVPGVDALLRFILKTANIFWTAAVLFVNREGPEIGMEPATPSPHGSCTTGLD